MSDSHLEVRTNPTNVLFTSALGTSTYAGVRVEGLFIGSSGSFGTGSGNVVSLANATTAPTTNPSGGGVAYAEGGALKWRGSGGAVSTAGPVGSGTAVSQNNLWVPQQGVVTTTDDTVTTILTYSPPINSGSVIRAMVVGRNTSTDAVAIYTIVSGHTRAAAGPTAYSTTTVIEEPAAGYNAAISVSGNTLILTVLGAVGANMDWEARMEVLEN